VITADGWHAEAMSARGQEKAWPRLHGTTRIFITTQQVRESKSMKPVRLHMNIRITDSLKAVAVTACLAIPLAVLAQAPTDPSHEVRQASANTESPRVAPSSWAWD